jgi:GxxExxY protein
MLTKENTSDISKIVVDCIFKVHKTLGAGLLENCYESCLAFEMQRRNLNFKRQFPLKVNYDGHKVECGYRLDFIVENCLILELKSVDKMHPVYDAQILTYLKHSNIKTGLLINFNVPLIKNGIKRFSN